MIIVEGKRWCSGVFILDRKLRLNNTSNTLDTKTIKITGKLVEEIFLDGKEIEEGEKARKIIFKSKSKVFIWKHNSKLGLLFEKRKHETKEE